MHSTQILSLVCPGRWYSKLREVSLHRAYGPGILSQDCLASKPVFSCSSPVLPYPSLPPQVLAEIPKKGLCIFPFFLWPGSTSSLLFVIPRSDFSSSPLKSLSIVRLFALKPVSTAATTVVSKTVQPEKSVQATWLLKTNHCLQPSRPHLTSLFPLQVSIQSHSTYGNLFFPFKSWILLFQGFPSYDTLWQTIWSG